MPSESYTVWCSFPGCMNHYHATRGNEVSDVGTEGWVHRDAGTGEPVTPVVNVIPGGRLLAVCPEHAGVFA